MNGITTIALAFFVVAFPSLVVGSVINRFFKFREKKLEVEAMNAAEKAAQYASRSHELEERVRVLEQIVTDGGAQTAAQIEALRSPARRVGGRKATQRDDVTG